MNLNHDREWDFENCLRSSAADVAPRAEHRDILREQVLAAFDRAVQTGTKSTALSPTIYRERNLMNRPISRYVMAACLLAALTWLLMPGSSTAIAFTKLVDAVLAAKSARFQAEITMEGQSKQTTNVAFLAPAKYRMELNKMINISDFENAKMLTLIPEQKQAVVFNLNNAATDRATLDQHNHFERLRGLLREQRESPVYERLGEKTIDGRKAVGFRLATPICTTTLWGDLKTGDPVRIESIYTGVPKTEVVMTQFEMNVELNPELFALDVPKDYKVQSFDIDASKPKEQDFVESLRLCTELSGGKFPDSLDTQGVMKLMISTMLKAKAGPGVKDADTERLMTQSMLIGRGFQFALSLTESANAYYAGKGVKKDTPDRPIFWYLPEGSKTYRVIDAALTVYDAGKMPQIDGAVPLFKKKPAGEKSK